MLKISTTRVNINYLHLFDSKNIYLTSSPLNRYIKFMQIRKIILLLGLGLTMTSACAQKKKDKTVTQETKLTTEVDSISYILGVNIATNLRQQGFTEINLEAMSKAFADVYSKNQLAIKPEEGQQILNQYFQNLQSKKAEKNLEEGKKFLEENKKKEGVVTLPSGLQYMVLKEGTGETPSATDKVTTHYHGTLIDGTVFDSSVERGQPATFPVNGVIQGWVEALQLMKVGSKWRLFIPPHLAYGERGAGESIGPNSTLIFEVELLSIQK